MTFKITDLKQVEFRDLVPVIIDFHYCALQMLNYSGWNVVFLQISFANCDTYKEYVDDLLEDHDILSRSMTLIHEIYIKYNRLKDIRNSTDVDENMEMIYHPVLYHYSRLISIQLVILSI